MHKQKYFVRNLPIVKKKVNFVAEFSTGNDNYLSLAIIIMYIYG